MLTKILVDMFSSLEGDVAEFGVHRGEFASILGGCMSKTNKTLHLFDSFEGLPELGVNDTVGVLYKGRFNDTSIDIVKKRIGPCACQIIFHKGWFENTIDEVADKKFCLIRIDCDLYEGYKLILNKMYDQLVIGGAFMLDDYQAPGCEGATMAVDEFVQERNLKVRHLEGQKYVDRYE